MDELEETLKLAIAEYLAKGNEIEVLDPSPELVELKMRKAFGEFNLSGEGLWDLKKEEE